MSYSYLISKNFNNCHSSLMRGCDRNGKKPFDVTNASFGHVCKILMWNDHGLQFDPVKVRLSSVFSAAKEDVSRAQC